MWPSGLQAVNKLLAQLALQCGWTDDVITVARSLFAALLVKITNSGSRWKTMFDVPEWQGLFRVSGRSLH